MICPFTIDPRLPRRASAVGALGLLAALASCAERSGTAPDEAPPSPAGSVAATEPVTAPDFPLQTWMKGNAARALVSGSPEALAGVFERIERFDPPGYDGWKSIATEGAAAARASSVDGCRRACKACHDQHRETYRARDRARPLR